jgi:large subunit ribosomal protein L6
MSRVGKKPVIIPAGVTAKLDGQKIAVKGAKGELSFAVPDDVAVTIDGNAVKIDPRSQTKRARAMWGMSRAMIANLVSGVTRGFERKLEINGVGYKAAVVGKNLQMSLGYSHDITYPIPPGVTIVAPKPTELTISGNDKRQVGQVASEIRALRGPEPYKGKGIKYAGEFIFRKEGKKK